MEGNKIALLIDAENISVNYVDSIMDEIAKFGKVVVSRFYGDITNVSLEWNEKATDYAIRPMHQYNVARGKNAADMALALDAMEIMYIGRVDTFFIVSSDSDFTPLSQKLREGGMYVVGIGNEKKVTKAFKSSCNEFKYFEYMVESNEDIVLDNDENKEKVDNDEINIEEIIKNIIIENGENRRLQLSKIGDILVNRFSDFDSRKYGAKQLSDLITTIKGLSITKNKTTLFVEFTDNNDREEIDNAVVAIISQNQTKKMKLSKIGVEIRKKYPDFNPKNYGFTQFNKFLSSIPGVEVKGESALVK